MAGGMKTTGTEELSAMLGKLSSEARRIASYALYDGAAVVANAYQGAVGSIRTAEFKYAPEGQKRLPTPEEVAIIRGKVGVSRFKGSGAEVNTLVGIQEDGYESVNWNHMKNSARTKYKLIAGGKAIHSGKAKATGVSGQSAKPIGVIANAINSGTSFMTKQPVFRKAVSAARSAAQKAMEDTAEKLINEITK